MKKSKNKYAILISTRPDIIKLEPVIKYLENNKMDYFVIHTNQHYSYELDALFLSELKYPNCIEYNLDITKTDDWKGSHHQMVGRLTEMIGNILDEKKPTHFIVYGDTNSTLAGAIACSKFRDIKLVHIEAGLRSGDLGMPEEINRIITDKLSDYLFCPTSNERTNLYEEGIYKSLDKKIEVVGNTISDVLNVYGKSKNDFNYCFVKEMFSEITISANIGSYLLLTMHRPALVDNKEKLQKILNKISILGRKQNKYIIFPVHPRTYNNIEKFNIGVPNNITLCEPVGYLEMIKLMKNADMILSDSGGISEEAAILKKHCMILRDSTERPEVVECGSGMVVSNNPTYDDYKKLKSKKIKDNPFGKNVTEKIFKVLEK